jgi:hypothetical protein
MVPVGCQTLLIDGRKLGCIAGSRVVVDDAVYRRLSHGIRCSGKWRLIPVLLQRSAGVIIHEFIECGTHIRPWYEFTA